MQNTHCDIAPEKRPVRTLEKAEQHIKKLEDILSWVSSEAQCIKTRRFVARALRELEKE